MELSKIIIDLYQAICSYDNICIYNIVDSLKDDIVIVIEFDYENTNFGLISKLESESYMIIYIIDISTMQIISYKTHIKNTKDIVDYYKNNKTIHCFYDDQKISCDECESICNYCCPLQEKLDCYCFKYSDYDCSHYELLGLTKDIVIENNKLIINDYDDFTNILPKIIKDFNCDDLYIHENNNIEDYLKKINIEQEKIAEIFKDLQNVLNYYPKPDDLPIPKFIY